MRAAWRWSSLGIRHAPSTVAAPRCFCSEKQAIAKTPKLKSKKSGAKESKLSLRKRTQQLWSDSLSWDANAEASEYVIGVDPDFRGAIAVLKTENDQLVAQVFDVPTLKIVVGDKLTLRPDTRSMIQLLRSLKVPEGTHAYVESGLPFANDGKKGWWASGFGYGLWIGILMTAGMSVKPVRPPVWKSAAGMPIKATKDDSRMKACMLFPGLAPELRRKKDHGRAEALLIAAFGKGLFGESLADSDSHSRELEEALEADVQQQFSTELAST